MQTRVPARNGLCTPADCVRHNNTLQAEVTVEMVSHYLIAELPIKPRREDPPIPTVSGTGSNPQRSSSPACKCITYGPQTITSWDDSPTRLRTIERIQSQPIRDKSRQEAQQPLVRLVIEWSRGSQVAGRQRGVSLQVVPHICKSCYIFFDILPAETGDSRPSTCAVKSTAGSFVSSRVRQQAILGAS